jgi:hypothetical protein
MVKICFCSSQKFRPELEKFINEFRKISKNKAGFVILHPEFEKKPRNFELSSEKARLANKDYRRSIPGLVYNHLFRKVKQSDVVFIFNKGGYIGANTYGELFAAAIASKLIFALNPKFLMGDYPKTLYEEPSASYLVHDIAKTPKELFEKVK